MILLHTLLLFLFAFALTSCGRKPVREFHLEPEPVRLDLRLYADSTFEETAEELEGTYEYTGKWKGSLEENGVFHLYLIDSLEGVAILINHGNYLITNG